MLLMMEKDRLYGDDRRCNCLQRPKMLAFYRGLKRVITMFERKHFAAREEEYLGIFERVYRPATAAPQQPLEPPEELWKDCEPVFGSRYEITDEYFDGLKQGGVDF